VELFIDDKPASVADLAHQALSPYGAFTSFCVEDGSVRGLHLHLERLETSAIELFGQGFDQAELRQSLQSALGMRHEAWVRVSLFSRDIRMRAVLAQGAPQVMVAVSDPPPALKTGLTLQPQVHQRHSPHLKHVATFDLIQARRTAQQAGYDDALFVDQDGFISEGSVWNIGFLEGRRVIWPRARVLAGVTQALIAVRLEGVGLSEQTRRVSLSDLGTFDGAFICNSTTPACAVSAIGEQIFRTDPMIIERLKTAWSNAPLERICSTGV